MKPLITLILAIASAVAAIAGPVEELIERVAPGRSAEFLIEKTAPDSAGTSWFELGSLPDGRVRVAGPDYTSIAAGLGHYFQEYCHTMPSWTDMTAHLPAALPAVEGTVRRRCDVPLRYYLNYCTYSYSMPFWDWDRWQREIDWMALRGINMPLALTGSDAVWRAVLSRLGYPDDRVGTHIAGPAFQAWWLMNNLEEWGGPEPDSRYDRQMELQRKVLARMRELDMRPVLPGYSGMLPADAAETLGLDVADPGLWCSYRRPAFLQPTDPAWARVADIYYQELTRLYGTADFYSMDPFHEGGSTRGVDLDAAAGEILGAMKRANPDAVWVIQAWGENPRAEMLGAVPAGDMLVLDLSSECVPQWGVPGSDRRPGGFGDHLWAFCMLLNYGILI